MGRHIALNREQGPGGGRERPMVGDGEQALELFDFHGSGPSGAVWQVSQKTIAIIVPSNLSVHAFTFIMEPQQNAPGAPPNSPADRFRWIPLHLDQVERPRSPAGPFPFPGHVRWGATTGVKCPFPANQD